MDINKALEQLRDAIRDELRGELIDELIEALENDIACCEAVDAPEIGTETEFGRDEIKGLQAAINELDGMR